MPPIVLIVDDEPALNDLFVIGLNKFGFVTRGALGGRECLELMGTDFQPDLILLDMMMEPMDGWETLVNLKRNGQTRKVPVIMQTGKNLTYKEAEQFSFYIEDYIMKPITPKKCVDHIINALEKMRMIYDLIDRGIQEGYESEKVDRFTKLFRALDITEKLIKILDDRYGISSRDRDPDNYGPEEYRVYVDQMISEYKSLSEELPIFTPFLSGKETFLG